MIYSINTKNQQLIAAGFKLIGYGGLLATHIVHAATLVSPGIFTLEQ